MTLLRFENVGKTYAIQRERSLALRILRIAGKSPESVDAVRDLSFSLARGEALGFTGPNGAGKTTALRLAAGVTSPTRGVITRSGRTAAVLGAAVALHPELSGIENVLLNGALHGLTIREVRARLGSVLDLAGLGNFIHAPVQTYSAGMCARLGLSLAMHADFEVIIIDEVIQVGDSEFQDRIVDRFLTFLREGKSVLFATHSETLAEKLDARTIALDRAWSSHS